MDLSDISKELNLIPTSENIVTITLGQFSDFGGTTYIDKDIYDKIMNNINKDKSYKSTKYSQKKYIYKNTVIDIHNYKSLGNQGSSKQHTSGHYVSPYLKKYYNTKQIYSKLYNYCYISIDYLKRVKVENVHIINKYHDIIERNIIKYKNVVMGSKAHHTKNDTVALLFIEEYLDETNYKVCIQFVNKNKNVVNYVNKLLKIISK